MMRALRLMLGASVLAILLPAVSYALTGRLDAWLPGSEHSTTTPIATGDLLSESPLLDPTFTSDGVVAFHTSAPPVTLHPEPNLMDVVATVDGNPDTTDSNPPTTAESEPPTTTSGASTTSSSQSEQTTSTQRGSKQTTTTPPPTSGSVITGDACPCTVEGTSTLQGTVNLKGDLMVKGGTLVARPGVTVNGNGYQIMFMDGGRADFQGTKTSTWSGNGSNANISRDITFKNMRRIMFHQGASKSTLRYFSVHDSGTSALGDYPIHFHLNGDSTRGTIVEGVVVVNGRHHAFVPHGSHGITFKDTIAKNTRGDAYWWDPPGSNESCTFQKYCTLDNSNDITYDHALADGVTPVAGDKGYRLTGFRLEAGSGNVIKNSSAINVGGKVDCSGFHWPESANQNQGGNVWVFKNNQGQSNCHGIFVWQNDSNRHIIDGFTGGGIDQGAYANTYDYRNVDVPYVEIIATGWSMSSSHAGDAIAKSHTAAGTINFTNVTFDSFTVDDGAKEPATYLLNGTNLTCSDIIIKSMAAGSGVVIDGKDC